MIFKVSVHNARLDVPEDPSICPPALAVLLASCWDSLPERRPAALEVQQQIEALLASLLKKG